MTGGYKIISEVLAEENLETIYIGFKPVTYGKGHQKEYEMNSEWPNHSVRHNIAYYQSTL